MNNINCGESEDFKTSTPEPFGEAISTSNPSVATTIESLSNEELFSLTPETWIGHPSTSSGALEQLIDNEIDVSFISESEKPSPNLGNVPRSSSSVAVIRKIEAIPLNEFEIFGKFVASELRHMANTSTARRLKAELQMVLASSQLHLQNEILPRTLQVDSEGQTIASELDSKSVKKMNDVIVSNGHPPLEIK